MTHRPAPPHSLPGTVLPDGRIALPGQPLLPPAFVGYAAPPPAPRLLAALAALLAAEPAVTASLPNSR